LGISERVDNFLLYFNRKKNKINKILTNINYILFKFKLFLLELSVILGLLELITSFLFEFGNEVMVVGLNSAL